MVFSFQLTTSQGGRPRAAKHCCFCIYISTHDLTRRSTVTGRCLRLSASYFNSRPHKEVDMQDLLHVPCMGYFNSRPHKEVDSNWYWRVSWITYFNSRPHKEVDVYLIIGVISIPHFNSRPHKEVDLEKFETSERKVISTHDLTRRSTKIAVKHTAPNSISTHDLTRRSTF